MNKITFPSYAKINLYLEILEKRPDGFHNIRTIYQAISLKDTIKIDLIKGNDIKINSNSKDIPTDASNLVYQAALSVLDKVKIRCGLKINIDKKIPVAAGLGGGSSNAASVILGLNKLLNLKLKKKEMLNIASSVGSDVSFFILEESVALGEARGDKVTKLKKIPKFWFIVVCPKIEISAKWAYSRYKLGLTREKPGVRICIRALRSGNLGRIAPVLYNDLETVILAKHTEIKDIKNALNNKGVRATLTSGSGPCIFGILQSREEAMRIRGELRRKSERWAMFICHSRCS